MFAFITHGAWRLVHFCARVRVILGGPAGIKRELSKLNNKSRSVSSGAGGSASFADRKSSGSSRRVSVRVFVSVAEAPPSCEGGSRSRASCCWRRLRRVMAARALALFSTFLLATNSNSSATSQPRRADAGKVQDTPTVVVVSFPPIVIFTAASRYEAVSPCAQRIITSPSRMSSSVTNSLHMSVWVVPVLTSMLLQNALLMIPRWRARSASPSGCPQYNAFWGHLEA